MAHPSGVHGTAFSAAALRAWHTLRGDEPKIFRDELALPLTGMEEEEVVALGERVPPSSSSTCALRSRFTEDRLAAARVRLSQYVVLGAGLDSYALRMGEDLGDLVVFEVDDPVLQEWKVQRISQLGLATPRQLRFVPCDFEQTSVTEALAAGGFIADQPCFISWLGVTQYLTRAAVVATLRWAGGCPPGSEIVLTYLEANVQSARLRASSAEAGISFLSDFSVIEMTAMLEQAGFSAIEHLSIEESESKYFRGRTDGLKPPEIQRLVSATV